MTIHNYIVDIAKALLNGVQKMLQLYPPDTSESEEIKQLINYSTSLIAKYKADIDFSMEIGAKMNCLDKNASSEDCYTYIDDGIILALIKYGTPITDPALWAHGITSPAYATDNKTAKELDEQLKGSNTANRKVRYLIGTEKGQPKFTDYYYEWQYCGKTYVKDPKTSQWLTVEYVMRDSIKDLSDCHSKEKTKKLAPEIPCFIRNF